MSARHPLPPGGVAFTVKLLNYPINFRRYPIEVTPPENLCGFVNNRNRQTAAIYRDGMWLNQSGQPITWGPTEWTALDDERPAD